jgi:hypothetical protein
MIVQTLQQIVSVSSQVSLSTANTALGILGGVMNSSIAAVYSLSNSTIITALASCQNLSVAINLGQSYINVLQVIGKAVANISTTAPLVYTDPSQSVSVVVSAPVTSFVSDQLLFADNSNVLPFYQRLVASTTQSNPFASVYSDAANM